MDLETDIRRIEELTRQNEDEDRRYRRVLDSCNLTSDEIDAIVHRHFKAVSEQIECQDCGNCCKVFRPLLKVEDVARLARSLEVSEADFIAEHLVGYGNGEGYFFRLTPCPFLVNNSCTVYAHRPGACRLYPRLGDDGFLLRLGLAFASCSVCPVVYNVYERVKREICGSRATTVSSGE